MVQLPRRLKGSKVQLPVAFKSSIACGVQKVQKGFKGLGFGRVSGLKLTSLVSLFTIHYSLHYSLFTIHS